MANLEYVDMLRRGVEIWNRWREAHPGTRADLSGVDLHAADLSFINLHGADLSYANFRGAKLLVANLSSVNLMEADLSEAFVAGTVFANVDLSQVKGLESVQHGGKSYLDIHAIHRSKGNIPEAFLRGIGAPDTLIEYARALVSTPIEFYTCFISYASKDHSFTQRLYADLQSNGVRCWFASRDLKIGDHYHQRIDESIQLYDKLVLVLSEHAVQSAWVEREVVTAREKEDHLGHEVLFPIRLDDAVMDTTKAWAADVRRRWHIGDFIQWKHHDAYQQAFERLLRDLKAEEKP
jgi:TIR domain/Pentapeptide repeats (8 copies)